MAGKEYLTFVDSLDNLKQGTEIEPLIKDLTPGRTKYEARYVKAVVSDDPDTLPGSDLLWVRGLVGRLYPKPWGIKILKEVGELPSTRDA
ncbi:MAG: phenylphosphate carboxylase subunit gamma [Candidatus Tectomicrobia bacterium]|uniref:Phenylphosphate carboxylase subunit gamma n=1 Tax=Tectimicrobiota bacterium TaxID=2528274 RepID=A0A932M2S0_UNCTE|nr:phenylphosphate carboxylase subunit gamma [Candidatus Tectomicrobia bacterium]